MQVRKVQVRGAEMRDGEEDDREPRAAQERNFREVEGGVAGIWKTDGLHSVNHMITLGIQKSLIIVRTLCCYIYTSRR